MKSNVCLTYRLSQNTNIELADFLGKSDVIRHAAVPILHDRSLIINLPAKSHAVSVLAESRNMACQKIVSVCVCVCLSLSLS